MDIQELLEKLQKLDELKLQELVELHASLKEAFNKVRAGEIEGVEADDIAVLKDLANAAQKANDRAVELQVDKADVDAEIEKLSEAFKAEDTDPNEGDSDDESTDGDDKETSGEESEGEPQPGIQKPGEPNPETEDDKKEIVIEEEREIKVPSLAALNAAAKKQQQRVTVKQPEGGNASRYAGQFADTRFTSVDGREVTAAELADMVISRREAFGSSKDGVVEDISLARMKLDIPRDRFLDFQGESEGSREAKIDAVTAGAIDPEVWTDAIVASGGWCAPLATDYNIEVIAGAHRPVRDSLPAFGATRGGIRLRRGIGIGSGAGAIGSWTNTIDITPAGQTKPLLTVACDTIFETVLRAVTQRVQFGNFRGRADNEGVQAWLQVVAAAHARRAEQLLLDEITAGSTAVTQSQQIGAARDLLVAITYAAAGVRSRNRLPADARIRVMFPQWVPDMISADLTRGLQSDPAFLGITTADITRWLAARNVNVTWYADEATGQQPHQIFDVETTGALNDFPGTVFWYAFPEGSWLFLDGGTLDLGVVRDSVLNATNDYQLFAETFEAAAFRGVESLRIASTVCVNGESSGGTDQNALCNS